MIAVRTAPAATVHSLGRQYQVTVATSDGLEHIIIMGQGAQRMSAAGLKEEIQRTKGEVMQEWHRRRQSSRNYLFDSMPREMTELMEEVRLGKKSMDGKKE